MSDVLITAGVVELEGSLTVPESAAGVVLFAHGSGSSRHSPRNAQVAERLNGAGFGTLLFDLLTADEARNRGNVFDIALLAERLRGATGWVRQQPETSALAIGYFGASTGAAAALWAAADEVDQVAAVVSRGGRPDLVRAVLDRVAAPTLLIVGQRDEPVIEMNREARRYLRCPNTLEIVPGATHLFEEPGALEAVAELAIGWFGRYVGDVAG